MHFLSFTLSQEGVGRIHDIVGCLSKFSDTVVLEAQRDTLTLTALNLSKTAHASFRLDAKLFFEKYSYSHSIQRTLDRRRHEEGSFTCQISNKALYSVFKGRLPERQEKNTAVERCEVSVKDDPEKVQCRLNIKMKCRHGVIKTYRLTYEPAEVLNAVFNKESAQNRWTMGADALKTFVEYFGAGTEQLDFWVENGRVTFTSYTEKVVSGRDVLKQPLRTSIAVDALDFEEFKVEENLRIGISVKDFRAIVVHAETLKGTVNALYSYPTRPLQLTHQGHGMECDFTLATIGEYRGGSVTPAAQAIRSDSIQPPSETLAGDSATQRTLSESMPPPIEPASRSFPRPPPSQQSRRPSPPRPKATIDPDSLFLPAEAEDEDRIWGERNFEAEDDVLGWDSNANTGAAVPSFATANDGSTTHSRLEPYKSRFDSEQRVAPTQRLSEIPTLFDD